MQSEEQPSRLRILGTWAYSYAMIFNGATCVSMLLSPSKYPFRTSEPYVHTFWEVLLFTPLGWVLSLVSPLIWISLAALGFALWFQRPKLLWISVAMSFVQGLVWPPWFTGLMGI